MAIILCTFLNTQERIITNGDVIKSFLSCPSIIHTTLFKTDPTLKVTHEHPANKLKLKL